VTTAPERAIEQRDELGLPADPFGSGQVGKPVLRYGGGDRASGAQRFVADLAFPGALQVALVTVPVGCADVLGIDTTAARAIPGVVDVVTPADLPSPMPRFGVSHLDRPVLADGRVNYHGEPVAAVVAETADAAHAAARAVVVDHRELPGVYSLDAALADGAHLVQDPSIRPGHALADTNVLEEAHYAWGDVDAEEQRTDVVVENTYTFPMVTHFPIEPGSSNVYRLNPRTGEITIVASGFTTIEGIDFDRRGNLYVLESMTLPGFPTPAEAESGKITRVSPSGDRDTVLAGLSFPSAMKFGPDGKLYISNLGFAAPPGVGQILRVDVQ